MMIKFKILALFVVTLVPLIIAGCSEKGQSKGSTSGSGKMSSGKPEAKSNVAPQSGYSLFKSSCVMCHGNEGNGFGSRRGPSLKRQEYKYGRTRESVMESIRNGRPKGMPAYGKFFTEEQLEALTSYVLSLN
jgi:cytochrome c oxidase cbb3-type subunit 3